MQGQIVLLYQLLEAVIQDIKPGGMLNAEPAGRAGFAEALTLSERAKAIAEQVLVDIERLYPDAAQLLRLPSMSNRSFDTDAQQRAFASLRSSLPAAGQLRR